MQDSSHLNAGEGQDVQAALSALRGTLLAALEITLPYLERVAATMPTQGPGIARQRAAMRDLKIVRAAMTEIAKAAA